MNTFKPLIYKILLTVILFFVLNYKDSNIGSFTSKRFYLSDLHFLLGKNYNLAMTHSHRPNINQCLDSWVEYDFAKNFIHSSNYVHIDDLKLYTYKNTIEIIYFSPRRATQNYNDLFGGVIPKYGYSWKFLISSWNNCSVNDYQKRKALKCNNHNISYRRNYATGFSICSVDIQILSNLQEWLDCFNLTLKAPEIDLKPEGNCLGCYGYKIILYRNNEMLTNFLKVRQKTDYIIAKNNNLDLHKYLNKEYPELFPVENYTKLNLSEKHKLCGKNLE